MGKEKSGLTSKDGVQRIAEQELSGIVWKKNANHRNVPPKILLPTKLKKAFFF